MRLALALLVGVVLSVLAYVLLLLVFLVSAIAFSAYTGSALEDFIDKLEPPAYAAALAVMFAWFIYLVNAVVASRGYWFKTIALAAAVGAAVAVMKPAVARHIVGVPLSAMRYLHSELIARRERQEAAARERAFSVAASSPEVLAAAGGIPSYSIASERQARDGETTEYDVAVKGTRTVYAIVRVEHAAGGSRLVLACVTPLSVGYRLSKDSCVVDPAAKGR